MDSSRLPGAVVGVDRSDGTERWRVDAPSTPVVQPAGAVSVGAGHLYVVGQTDALAGRLRSYEIGTE